MNLFTLNNNYYELCTLNYNYYELCTLNYNDYYFDDTRQDSVTLIVHLLWSLSKGFFQACVYTDDHTSFTSPTDVDDMMVLVKSYTVCVALSCIVECIS